MPYLTFGEGWELALVKASIPHREGHFPSNQGKGGLAVHYNASPSTTSSQVKQTTVRVDDIVDGLGKGTTRFDLLKMINTVPWN